MKNGKTLSQIAQELERPRPIIGYVYHTKNLLTGKHYVGLTRRVVFDRAYLGSGKIIRRAIAKHGCINFSVEKLVDARSELELNSFERWYIELHRKKYGNESVYNITDGGTGGPTNSGKKFSQQHKDRISNALKGKPKSLRARMNMSLAMLKRPPISEATREKMRASAPVWNKEQRERASRFFKGRISPMKGKHHTAEARMKISQAGKGRIGPMRGKRLSEETRKKISQSGKGRVVTAETRAKIGAGHRGKIVSQETREKIRIAATNPSPETRARMSIAAKNRKRRMGGQVLEMPRQDWKSIAEAK